MNPFNLIGTVILIIVISTVCANFRRKHLYSKKLVAPPWADVETKKLFKQFNEAWSITIEKTVNMRIKKAKRTLTDTELRERWYELKKFLFLAGISKGLPMFSEKVDDIWHFFLEDKELYDAFCVAFIGDQIEHHPHETPKNLPNERAWFDILYLSFFNITSHSHLWGKFMQEKKEHAEWIERIIEDSEAILESFGRSSSTAESVQTLDAFLQFSKEQVTETNKSRVKQIDGYWYGAALFSLHSYAPIPKLKEKERKAAYADGSAGSIGFVANPEHEEKWNEFVTDVNTFELGTDSGSTSGTSSDSGGSDSGSSCSSCSGCSS